MATTSQYKAQPAADLISATVSKIKKLAGNRKYQKLSEECQDLLEHLPEVLSPEYAIKAVRLTAAGANGTAATQQPKQEPSLASEASEVSMAQELGATEDAGDAATEASGTPDASAVAAASSGALATEVAASAASVHTMQDHGISTPTKSSTDPAATADAAAAASAAAAAQEAAAEAKRAADAARLAAAAAPVVTGEDMVPRTDAAISDPAALRIMQVLNLAVDTGKANIVDVTLDLINKLIAYRYLQGAAHHVNMDRQADMGETHKDKQHEGAVPHYNDITGLTPQAMAVQLVCRCDEIADENVEVLILRGLLTATTSITFTLHNTALLLAVRTCYNIHLMSRSEVNQTTAKATLTQMLNVVFQRMEANSVLVQVKPIVVADMLGMANPKHISPADNMIGAVQGFLNNVVTAAGYSMQPSPEQVKLSVAEAMSRRNSISGAPEESESSSDDEDDADMRERFQLGQHLEGAGQGAPSPAAAARSSESPQRSAAPGSLGGTHHHRHQHHYLRHHPHLSNSPLLKDAFLVFRALCKLSIRTSDTVTVSDPTAVRGKLLALELLKVLLENSGPTFRSNERFTAAIRQYLCLSLLKNSASSIPAALQLSASIFLSLLQRFRQVLKAEVGVFFPMIMLKVVEPPAPGAAGSGQGAQPTSIAINAYSYKVVVLRCLREVCGDGQLLVDLFVNYDCDLGSSNLFERLINGLVKIAQSQLPQGGEYTALQQEQWLRQEALQCLASASEALLKWYRKSSGLLPGEDKNGMAKEEEAGPSNSAAAPASPGPVGKPPGTPNHHHAHSDVDSLGAGEAALSMLLEARATASSGGAIGGGDALSKKRAYKEKFQEGVALFNKKPKKGIAFMQEEGMLGRTPEDIAAFLRTEGLNKTTIGDYLGEREDMALKVMHAYVDAMSFEGMEFDTAIRTFLQGFRLPGEAQKIDRLMEKFAERFLKCNPGSFRSADVAYVLAYSVIMLNTDAHNPQVKKKMSCEGFLKNNRGINDGQDLPADFMKALYDRIVNNEIKMKDDAGAETGTKAEAEAAQRGNLLMNALWSIVGGQKQQVSAEPSDDAIRRTLDHLHDVAKGATYFSASEPDTVRPMLELIWAPLLGCFSLLFDEYADPRLLKICLSGFAASACLAADLGVSSLRDVFVNSLCNFTHLHSPATMKPKNGLAFKYLLKVAVEVGNNLGERWLEVLRCISRWELLQQIASGMPTDAVLFAAPNEKGLGKAAAAALKDQLRKLSNLHGLDGGISGGMKSMESMAMSEVSIKKAHIGASGREEEHVIPQDIINSVDTAELNKVYMRSSALDSDAIVHFVRALAAISLDELQDPTAPRVFSLTKIVEISHFNMTRIRLVWSRIWAVLSEYFIKVGCHANLAVAMYAVDSLRQLAMKFLERDELANYTFQNDFLRPFVVVMRQSQAVFIRELIIRCLSQMVLARVANIKSGWKSMFMVFTTAAGDNDSTIVRLAFDTIEKIVREHFNYITETETTTFTDCVNCLIAFTNNPHSLEVALNSIAFLRFCAIRLAEGAIGELPEELPEGVGVERVGLTRVVPLDKAQEAGGSGQPLQQQHKQQQQAHAVLGPGGTQVKFMDTDEHVYFWFPLLAGLSELTFDPRQEIRHSALEVLFDTLRYHGGTFAESFWARIFDSVLLPIFDHVRAEVTDTTTFTSEKRRQQEDAWLYETCTRCLQHLVDLFAQYWDLVGPMLGRLLQLLGSFISRSHASLASVGVAALSRTVDGCGKMMSPETWQEVVDLLYTVSRDTLPDPWELVTPPQRGSHASSLTDLTAAAAAGSTGPSSPAVAAAGAPMQRASPTASSPQRLPLGTAAVAAANQAAAAAAASSGLRPPYTLREGVGMRRLAKFRVQVAVQLLLVQAAGEMYASQHQYMSATAIVRLLDCLALVSNHARTVNTDLALRRRLAAQQAEDRVPEDKAAADPPLIRQETEACHAYLSVLLHIYSVRGSSSGSSSTSLLGSSSGGLDTLLGEVEQLCKAQQRLLDLCFSILERFGLGAEAPNGGGSSSMASAALAACTPCGLGSSKPAAGNGLAAGGGGGPAKHPGSAAEEALAGPGVLAATTVEYQAFAPLVVSTLKALCALEDATFKEHLPRFFPALIRLIQCDYAPSDVQRALSDLFITRMGPLLGCSCTEDLALLS